MIICFLMLNVYIALRVFAFSLSVFFCAKYASYMLKSIPVVGIADEICFSVDVAYLVN